MVASQTKVARAFPFSNPEGGNMGENEQLSNKLFDHISQTTKA